MSVCPLITLTTDFGVSSPYVAPMKGTILQICRDAEVLDLTHAIGPQNVREGAVVLADATPWFPPGTIHVAVVDPGVGTCRRLVYAEFGSQRYLAPDNGLLSLVAITSKPTTIVCLENWEFWLPETSQTFHGRDILAPVAAHLAKGIDPDKLGPVLDLLMPLEWPIVQRSQDFVQGQILYIDSFGNLISNLKRADLEGLGNPASWSVQLGGRTIQGIVATYGSAMPGELVALFDSQGRLEIALVHGSAAQKLGLSKSDLARALGDAPHGTRWDGAATIVKVTARL